MASIKKAGIEFQIKIDTKKDLIGKSDNFSAKFVNDADGVITDVTGTWSEVELDGTGIGVYMCPVTISAAGDYTMLAMNDTDGMEHIAFPVEVKDASIDDVKELIDALQTDMTAVKSQVDTLDEDELNGIAESLATVATNVSTIEGLLDGDDNASLQVLKDLLDQISGTEGIESIKGFVDNVELMLEGKEYVDTEGNTVLADDSKGLVEIFTAITANGTSISAANDAIADLDSDIAAFKTSVEDKVAAVDAKLVDMADATVVDSLAHRLAAVKTVVDSNSAVLLDSGYGNEALKALLDALDTDLSDNMTTIAGRFDDVDSNATTNTTTITDAISALDTVLDTANSDIQDLINAQTVTLENRFTDVDNAIANVAASQSFGAFV